MSIESTPKFKASAPMLDPETLTVAREYYTQALKNEQTRADLLAMERELVEASAAQVAVTTKAHQELQEERRRGGPHS